MFLVIHEVLNKYNKDALLLDHYNNSSLNITILLLKFKQVLGKMQVLYTIFNANDVACSFIGKKIQLIMSFNSGVQTVMKSKIIDVCGFYVDGVLG